MFPPDLAPHGETVVLVEARPDRRAALARALQDEGCVVYAVGDVESALEAVCETDACTCVVAVDVPHGAASALRAGVDALATLRPLRLYLHAFERAAA